jgi:hypothetical protein
MFGKSAGFWIFFMRPPGRSVHNRLEQGLLESNRFVVIGKHITQ